MRSGYPIVYRYDGTYHCPKCAIAAFGEDADGLVPEKARDGAGKALESIAPWDEWYVAGKGDQSITCSECGDEIDRYEE